MRQGAQLTVLKISGPNISFAQYDSSRQNSNQHANCDDAELNDAGGTDLNKVVTQCYALLCLNPGASDKSLPEFGCHKKRSTLRAAVAAKFQEHETKFERMNPLGVDAALGRAVCKRAPSENARNSPFTLRQREAENARLKKLVAECDRFV